MTDSAASQRQRLMWALRALVLVIVGLAVSRTVRVALGQLSQHDWSLRPAWLIVAGALYGVGLVPMGWLWYRALAALGQPAPWWATLRAYFLGHLGKYVPGKALAVVLRVAAVRPWVASMRIAVASAMIETLTMMAVGATLAAALSLIVLRLEPRVALLAVGMAVVAGLPTLPPIARRVAQIGIFGLKSGNELPRPPARSTDVARSLQGINMRLLASGWLAAGTCWLLLGLSLWATLQAIDVQSVGPVSELPVLVATVAFAVVAGFLSMLPGGLVVRDALVMQLLAPVCGQANALVAAVLLRLVWLVTEVVVCGILYLGVSGNTRYTRLRP